MKRLLIFYSHFTPAFKAGGPVQSIQNMVDVLSDTFFVDIVCSAFDLNEREVLPGIVPDRWNMVAPTVSVLYIRTNAVRHISEAIRGRRPDCIYVNGMFLPAYSWLPLMLARRYGVPVVLTPRGMLQKGAMANSSFRKLLALAMLKFLRLHKGVTWHATDEQEKTDVQGHFGGDAKIRVIGNVPKRPVSVPRPIEKTPGDLKLIFLSLIAKKKNLDLLLRVLRNIERPVTLDIFGPAKDPEYWKECVALMNCPPHVINYCGAVQPADVQSTIEGYHAFVLLTRGENFGHAIYEALSVGRPVILSAFTPWSGPQFSRAGITVNIDDMDSCRNGIETFQRLKQADFDALSQGALDVAKEYYNGFNFQELYTKMFTEAEKNRAFHPTILSKLAV